MLADLVPPSFSWEQIDAALRLIPIEKWNAASRVGYTTDSGGLLVRITIADDLRRELERIAGRPLAANNPARCHPSAPPADS